MRLFFLLVLGLGTLSSCTTAPAPSTTRYDWHYRLHPETQAWLQQIRAQKQELPEAQAQQYQQECSRYWEEHLIMNDYCVSNRGRQFLEPHPEEALRFAGPAFRE